MSVHNEKRTELKQQTIALLTSRLCMLFAQSSSQSSGREHETVKQPDESHAVQDEDVKFNNIIDKTLTNGSAVDQDGSTPTIKKDRQEPTSSPWQPYSNSAFNSTFSKAPDMPTSSSSSAPFPPFPGSSMPPLTSDSVKREPGLPSDSFGDRPLPQPPPGNWPGLGGGPPPFLPPPWQLPDLGRSNPDGSASLDLTLSRSMASMAQSGPPEELLRQQLPYLPPPLLPVPGGPMSGMPASSMGGPYDQILQGRPMPQGLPPAPGDFSSGGSQYGRSELRSTPAGEEMEFETPSDSEMEVLQRSPSPEPQRVNAHLYQSKNAMYVNSISFWSYFG